MCAQNGLLQRPHGFYFQARVPEDCREEFGKAIYRKKLAASTLAEAKAQVRQEWVTFQQRVAHIREGGPSDTDIAHWTSTYIADLLEEDEEIRTAGLDDKSYRVIQESLDISNAGARQALARGDTRLTDFEMEDFLEARFGVKLLRDTDGYRRTAYAFLKAGIQAGEMMLARHRGEIVDTPTPPGAGLSPTGPQQAVTGGAPLLSEAIAYFLDNYSDKSKPMYRKHRSVLPVFLEMVGDRQVNEMRQMHLEDFAKLLCKLPPRAAAIARTKRVSIKSLAEIAWPKTIAPKTFEDTFMASVRPFIAASKRIFGDTGFPTNLTTEGIIYRGTVKSGQHRQRAMTDDEVRRLVAALQPFTTDAQLVHKFWLPMVGLYSGARINEVCQVNPQVDIATEGGIPYFQFTDATETDSRIKKKSIKNVTSMRRVPIHPALIAAGFLQYVEAIRASGARLLFPQLAPWRGKAAGEAEDWFTTLLRDNGLRDETPGKRVVGFHTFRSTFLARASALRVADADVLTGHVGDTSQVVRGYQGELGLKRKLEILKQITFDFQWPAKIVAMAGHP